MKNLKIDWYKLTDYNIIIVNNLIKKLPSDWKLSKDDLSSEVNQTFLNLIRIYKNGKKSLESWCYEWAESKTYHRLMAEYHKLKMQIPIDQFGDYQDELEDSNGNTLSHHDHGELIDSPDKSDIEYFEDKDAKEYIEQKANELGFAQIYKMIKAGNTEKQIAEKLGISHVAVHKKIQNFINTVKE